MGTIMRVLSTATLTVVVVVAAMFLWAMFSTPDSGIGSDAYQQGQEAAQDGEYEGEFGHTCSEANARDYLGGLPTRAEVDDWVTGCFVG